MAASLKDRTSSWFRSIVGVPRQQQQPRAARSVAVAAQQETGVQAPPGLAYPLPTVAEPSRSLPQDVPSAAMFQPPAPEPALEPSSRAPPMSMYANVVGQPAAPEASTRPRHADTIANQPYMVPERVPVGETDVQLQQMCRRSSLWTPLPHQSVQTGTVPLMSLENSVMVLGDYLKSVGEAPAEQEETVRAICQFFVLLFLTTAAVFVLCLLLFGSSFETHTRNRSSENPTGADESFRLEDFPVAPEIDVITLRGSTNGTTMTVWALYNDVAETATGVHRR
ncbi:uncharacterized protein LOC142578294 [Dermacentor variabilis]|uniref:uncharacterized protein LOC142578294 n=1 Tax=Dermacentor variabilis TaxID=34621 RepID=UPI003F5BAEE8